MTECIFDHMRDDFRRIQEEAYAQRHEEVIALEQTPLVFGEHIAWAFKRFGATDDLSDIHRVGFPVGNAPFTTCGEKIPAPVCWLPPSPGFLTSLRHCRYCEAEYARSLIEKGDQADAA